MVKERELTGNQTIKKKIKDQENNLQKKFIHQNKQTKRSLRKMSALDMTKIN